MNTSALHELLKYGQSIWLDYISRKLLDSGELDRWVKLGLRGMTSNPTIFEQAVSKSNDYDKEISELAVRGLNTKAIYETLAIADITRAADALRTVYELSQGTDGFISLEVSPTLANDTQGTIDEAVRLWEAVDRPNLMIKVPGTREGIPAIKWLLSRGMNVNITLLFSLDQYVAVLEAYQQALEERLTRGEKLNRIASVASFFVSRVDNMIDKELTEKGKTELCGKAAIANACEAYHHFLAVSNTERWNKLAKAGAQVQRPLWASTSTKNPAYSDVLYVTELIGENTVNTIPPNTLEAYMDHGVAEDGLLKNMKHSEETLDELKNAGINMNKVTKFLLEDGVVKFSDSFTQLMNAIETKQKSAKPVTV